MRIVNKNILCISFREIYKYRKLGYVLFRQDEIRCFREIIISTPKLGFINSLCDELLDLFQDVSNEKHLIEAVYIDTEDTQEYENVLIKIIEDMLRNIYSHNVVIKKEESFIDKIFVNKENVDYEDIAKIIIERHPHIASNIYDKQRRKYIETSYIYAMALYYYKRKLRIY